MIKCPHCGGEMDFEIKGQVVKCPYCDSEFNPKEEINKIKSASERNATEYDTGTTKGKCYTCSQCGAQLVTFDDTAVTFCNYCDSQALIESEINMLNPKYVIPFKKTKEEAIDLYKEKLNKSMFAPSSFKKDIILKKFRGIYMPYEIYDIESHENFEAKGERYSHRSGDYVIYDVYRITGKVDANYDGLSFDLSSSYSDDVSQAIPFNFKEGKEEFNHNYLIGNYADTSDVDYNIYNDDALKTVTDDIVSEISSTKELRPYSITGMKVSSHINEKRTGFFPVYFASFKNKKGDRIHYAVINGQTGKSAVDIPVDFKKYLVAVLLLAIPIFLVMQYFLTLTPNYVCIAAIIALVVAVILQSIDLKHINEKESRINDEGYNYKNTANADNKKEMIIEETKKAKKAKKIKNKTKGYGFPLFLSGVPSLLILMFHPFQDEFYYIAASISLALILIIFRLIINKHNTFIARPLPQLNKRGGDKDE